MEAMGRLRGITRDLVSGEYVVSFGILRQPNLDDIKDCDLDITAKKHREKRSLNANAYFHVLCGKLADKLRLSKPRCKNLLIGRYGQQDFLDDGTPIILKTNIAVETMLEQETLHCIPCGAKVENGAEVNFYKVMRPSHTYNNLEMSILIDGTVDECKGQGIETLTPAELERMINAWGK